MNLKKGTTKRGPSFPVGKDFKESSSGSAVHVPWEPRQMETGSQERLHAWYTKHIHGKQSRNGLTKLHRICLVSHSSVLEWL